MESVDQRENPVYDDTYQNFDNDDDFYNDQPGSNINYDDLLERVRENEQLDFTYEEKRNFVKKFIKQSFPDNREGDEILSKITIEKKREKQGRS